MSAWNCVCRITDLVVGDCFGGTQGSNHVYLIWLRILVVFIFLAPIVTVKEMTRHTWSCGRSWWSLLWWHVGGNHFVVGRLLNFYQHTCNQEQNRHPIERGGRWEEAETFWFDEKEMPRVSHIICVSGNTLRYISQWHFLILGSNVFFHTSFWLIIFKSRPILPLIWSSLIQIRRSGPFPVFLVLCQISP